MSETEPVLSRPWIPKDEAREKYEASGDRTAYGASRVAGAIVEVTSRTNDYGTYLLVTLQVPGEGRVSLHGQPQVLGDQLKKVLNMKYGDELTVDYLGEVVGNAGRTYSNYSVQGSVEIGSAIIAPAGFANTGNSGNDAPSPREQQWSTQPVASGANPDDDIPFD